MLPFFLAASIALVPPAQGVATVVRQGPGDTVRAAVLEDWPPHYLAMPGSPPTGFGVDVMDAVAAHAGFVVRYVVFPTFSAAIEALRDGRVEVIPDFGITPARSADFAFTRSFQAFQVSVVVRDTQRGVDAIDDLAGHRIGVVQSNVAAQLVSQRHPDLIPVVFTTPQEALFELLAGGVDAVAYPDEVLFALAREAGVDDRIHALPAPLLEVPRAIGVRRGDTELVRRLDEGVEALVGSPEYADIYRRWLTPPRPFWTVPLVLYAAGGLLLLVMVGMAGWRYRTVSRLVRTLSTTLAERDEAESDRRRHEARFQVLVEASYDGIVTTDADERITFVNRRVCEMLGREEDELIGRSVLEFIVPEHHERAHRGMERRHQGIADSYEVALAPRSGEPLWVQVAVSPLPADAAGFQGAMAVLTDITARVRAEELTAQLAQAQKMEAIGRLAGGVVHDFNNMLTVVRSHADLLALDPSPSVAVEAAEEIGRSVDRAHALTSQLLAFSRHRAVNPEPLDPGAVIRGLEDTLRRLMGETIDYRLSVEESTWRIRADVNQLEQILMNLAVNSKDALPDGGHVDVTVRNVRQTEPGIGRFGEIPPGDYVEIELIDDGVGMSAETLTHVFEPFFTTKGPGEGTGLGLATVYGIVRRSGGYLDVNSVEGEGSTFRMLFPRTVEEALAPEQPVPHQADSTHEAPETRRILLAEDDESVRRAVRRILSSKGYEIVEADSGAAALKAAEGLTGIDLLITDVVMPGITGPDLAVQLRQRWSDLRVVFMSGYSEEQVEAANAEDGFFVNKPFTVDELIGVVRRALDRSTPTG